MRLSGREDLTTGWYASKSGVPNGRLHMCFPPMAYPSEVGPGDNTRWQCPIRYCGIIWRPVGIQLLDGADYPVDGTRRDAIMGPEMWKFEEYSNYIHENGPYGVMRGEEQEAHYDFRPVSLYYVRMMRRMLEALGKEWEDLG